MLLDDDSCADKHGVVQFYSFVYNNSEILNSRSVVAFMVRECRIVFSSARTKGQLLSEIYVCKYVWVSLRTMKLQHCLAVRIYKQERYVKFSNVAKEHVLCNKALPRN